MSLPEKTFTSPISICCDYNSIGLNPKVAENEFRVDGIIDRNK
jgi:hypothetical protein